MSATDIQYPETEEEIARLVTEAKASNLSIEVRGGGTRLGLGRPSQSASALSVAKLSGITNYDPSELVMAARAGTPLSEIEAVSQPSAASSQPMSPARAASQPGLHATICSAFASSMAPARSSRAVAA